MPDPFSLSGSALTCTDATSANALLLPRAPLDDVDAAFVAGYELGKAERVEASIEDQVSGRLHAVALDALGMAQRHARAKGPAWAALIAECGERE